MSLIPGRSIRVREKILATPSTGVEGKTHVRRNKCADCASRRRKKYSQHSSFQIINLMYVFTPCMSLDSFSDVYLVSPLMGADLNNIVKTQKLSDDHVQFLVYQILRGLKYIHSAGIIHRVGWL